MMKNASFQQILEEKMARPAPSGTADPGIVTGANDPAHLAFLLGNMGVHRFQRRRSAPPPAPRARPKVEASAPVKPVRMPGPPHALNERQKSAMQWFERLGESLHSDFTAAEQKAAFRRLARRLHPDRGGDTATFLELKGHDEALKGVFASPGSANAA